jgi:Uri superfamily endonuclease
MNKGIYCLVFSTPGAMIRVGALGDLIFQSGWYVYVGSALGPGGLSRASRHIRFSRSPGTPRWHIDYLLASPAFTLRSVICACTAERAECLLAGALHGRKIPGFGCSDCSCASHLFYYARDPVPSMISVFRSIGLLPFITTLNTSKVQS